MIYLPIPFQPPMVRSILAGTKTQTRRVMKLHPSAIGCCCGGTASRWVAEGDRWHCGTCGGGGRLTAKDVDYVRCPYGQPGDRLWVREHWRAWHGVDAFPPRLINPGSKIHYEADGEADDDFGKFRPGMFMPRWASRLTLENTGVRVERLQDISEADAIAEGCRADAGLHGDDDLAVAATAMAFDQHHGRLHSVPMPKVRYAVLWESINGPGSWDANPWLWCIEFKRITP